MSNTTYCDICRQVIKPGAKKIAYVVQEAIQEDDKGKGFSELFKHYAANYQQPRLYEICEHCQKIYNYIFKKLRIDQLKSIQEELEKTERVTNKNTKKPVKKRSKKYCNCVEPLDKGLILYGEHSGFCALCGKKIKKEKKK